MLFFQEKNSVGAVNEKWRISFKRKIARVFIAVIGGICYAAALPPLNLEFLAFLTFVPLLYLFEDDTPASGAFHGFVWNFAWGVFAYRFLREIQPFAEFGLAAVVGAWGAVFGYAAVKLRDGALFPRSVRFASYEEKKRFFREKMPFLRQAGYAAGIAALYTLIEWSRSRLFPWNDLAVTQYRNLPLLQLCAVTGSCGVTFCVAFAGCGIYALWRFPKGRFCALFSVGIVALVMASGAWRLCGKEKEADFKVKFLLIQGDLSQRRHAGSASVEESLVVYHTLTQRALAAHPDADFVVWPECAIPVLYDSEHDLAGERSWTGFYQASMQPYPQKFLIGALDSVADTGVTNSALLLEKGKVLARYDKNHRVPFGEYIPARSLLPGKVIEAIDMGRDLTPGVSHDPLLLSDDLRAGVEICYESVFGYIARDTVRRGANILVVLSNDAWYPTSSEPEQHLANALLRSIETGVPMVRCGNNGGTLVVSPRGRIENVLVVPGVEKRSELRRGRGFRLTEVGVQKNPEKTFYLVHGEWFIVLLALGVAGWILGTAYGALRHRKEFYARITGKDEAS